MQEDFIHYLWKYKKFDFSDLRTTKNKLITIIDSGIHNHDSGPDFFNAQLRINDQIWAGNVELHLKSSDWFAHHHEKDRAYDNVILHVVWQDDVEVHRQDNSEIDTLILKEYVPTEFIDSYHKLFSKQGKWINCENDFSAIDDFSRNNWLERLFFERLERKSEEINQLLEKSKNDWETVLFKMLAKNFGLKVNSEAFFNIASSIPMSVLRKESTDMTNLEALFFGQGGLLNDTRENPYYLNLKEKYHYQKHKYKLDNEWITPLKFFRLRPSGFPTIRLSQLANLYNRNKSLFTDIIETSSVENIYKKLSVGPSNFWQTHYTFDKESKKMIKQTTKVFMDLIFINTIIPLKFSYANYQGKFKDAELLQWMSQVDSEKNGIVQKFNDLGGISKSAMTSQAYIQLKTNYCDKNKCLQCAIGNHILTN
jgi:hypothetical protein